MLRTKTAVWMVFLGALLTVSGMAVAGDDGEVRMKVKRMVHCDDGEDCDTEGHNVFMLKGDGDPIELRNIFNCEDGEDCSAMHGTHVVFMGEDGEIRQLDGSEVDWVSDGPRAMAMAMAHAAGGGGTYLGIQLNELTPELREHFGLDRETGVMVSKVVEGSPAEKAGLAVGDIVTAVDGEPVTSGSALSRTISSREDGETVAVEVWRDGQLRNLVANVAAREGGMGMLRRMGKMGGGMHVIEIDCEGEEDCGDIDLDFDCGGAEECEVRVECDGPGSCECTVNGETADCADIPGVHTLHLQHGGHHND